jgi:glycosyltransferase involved in cell wall biosynthesis
MVARLDPIKDHETLLRAFAKLSSRYPDARLWLIGDGSLTGYLLDLSQDLKLGDRVNFWGNRSDVPALLARMDVFAFSTTQAEGFGIALAEAMAAGVPVVASDVPACREVLDKGRCGLLVKPGDSAALAKALHITLSGGVARNDRVRNAKARALERYDIRMCARTLHEMALAPWGLGSEERR